MKSFIIIFSVLLLGFYISCINDNSKKNFRISGNLENLPDGKIFLVHALDHKNIIDSAIIHEGKFEFNTSVEDKDKFSEVSLMAKYKNDSILEFSFPTNKLYNGKPNSVNYFLLEDKISIIGTFTNFSPKNFKLPGKLKIIVLKEPVQGKQSWVLYNISLKYPRFSDDTIVMNDLMSKIESYPYSFFLLTDIDRNLSLLNEQQLSQILPLFNDEIKQTPLWKNLNKIAANALGGRKAVRELKLFNNLGKAQTILDTVDQHVNIIVFWASWCPPCLKEIPDLKKFYFLNKNNKKINMVSISVDKEKKDWQSALSNFKMPWTQLILSDANQQKDLLYSFKLDSTIPVILIVDNKGNIKKKFTGFDPEKNVVEKLNDTLELH